MTVKDIYLFLDKIAPFSTAADWDNSGLQLGGFNTEVSKVLLCLDVTEYELLLARKLGAQLIVSHHPLIFHPLHQIENDSLYARLLCADISVISAHTNLDKAPGGVNDSLCNALGLPFQKISSPTADGFLNLCDLPEHYLPNSFALLLKSRLHAAVKYYNTERQITKVGVCSGGGADFIRDASLLGCDAYLTGEATYHDFLSADRLGVTLFCAGHFETETVFSSYLCASLSERFPSVLFVVSDRKNPLKTVI